MWCRFYKMVSKALAIIVGGKSGHTATSDKDD
jgi:hypothetical protein